MALNNKISASQSYLKKELIRSHVESLILELVKKGEINDENSLKELFSNFSLVTGALAGVPYDVWKKIVEEQS